VAPDAACLCPQWLRFLTTITDGNAQLVSFLQRTLGYCLTGLTREHALFFWYGTGTNGKGTTLYTAVEILGEYHRVAPVEMLLATSAERHPTELAGLMGRRLVTAVETDEGRRWAEAKLKSMTGGDMQTARFMRGDFFDYMPEFKLVVVGNHKPALRNVDAAIRRRLHLTPFTVTIPDDEIDQGLREKLRAEYPGILQWMIDGCLEWQEFGLKPPACVKGATDEYLTAQDTVGRWMTERTRRVESWETPSGAIYADWKEWCEVNGEFVGSHKRLSQALINRGLTTKDGRAGSIMVGLKLLSPLEGAQ
jgi:P4 family phage/plasmid primase-like protien